MSQRREYASDWLLREGAVVLWHPRYDTELAALMEEAPGWQNRYIGQAALADTMPLREALADAIENLEPEDQWIIERLLIEGTSLRKTGAVLNIPKTTLARRRDRIRRHLMDVLVDHPSVRQWLRA